jgi:hypothetical protein
MDPDIINAHAYLYDIYTAREMYAEAVAEYFKNRRVEHDHAAYPGDLDDLRSTYAAAAFAVFGGGGPGCWKVETARMGTASPNTRHGLGNMTRP